MKCLNTELAFEIPRLRVFLGKVCLKEPRHAVPGACDNLLMYEIKAVSKPGGGGASRCRGQA